MERKEIESLVRFMRRHGVASFKYETEAVKLEIDFQGATQVVAAPVALPVAAPAPVAAAPAAAAPAPEKKAAEHRSIRAPIVGTFYRSPAPDQSPYVKVGDRVHKGQTVCIIEAMKLMNQIESDVEGVIAEILIENAQPVQFGQELFRVVAG